MVLSKLSKLYDEGPLRLMQWLQRRFGLWAALLPFLIAILILSIGWAWMIHDANH